MESEKKFCAICMKDVPFKTEVREEDVNVLGLTVHVCLTYLVDPEGHELYDYDTEMVNSEIVHNAYRQKLLSGIKESD